MSCQFSSVMAMESGWGEFVDADVSRQNAGSRSRTARGRSASSILRRPPFRGYAAVRSNGSCGRSAAGVEFRANVRFWVCPYLPIGDSLGSRNRVMRRPVAGSTPMSYFSSHEPGPRGLM
jgi:hypothetical protein